MGQIVYDHPEWTKAVYWKFDPEKGWDDYHRGLDEISKYANDTTEPFLIIFHPAGDVPKGNPISHMRRIVQFSKNNDMVIQTIIIMDTNWFIAKAFANLLNKIMSLEPEIKLVFSLDEAHETHKVALASRQKK